jgi:hypothetical protein
VALHIRDRALETRARSMSSTTTRRASAGTGWRGCSGLRSRAPTTSPARPGKPCAMREWRSTRAPPTNPSAMEGGMLEVRQMRFSRWTSLVVVLSACNQEQPSVASRPEAAVAAPVETVIQARIRSKNVCWLQGDRVFFHILFEINYSQTVADRARSRQLFQMDCDQRGACSGIHWSLDNADDNKPVTMMDIGRISGAELSGKTGTVVTVQWGPLRTFLIDVGGGSASYVESGEGLFSNVEGRADAKCQGQVLPSKG